MERRRHPDRVLTAVQVRQTKVPGRHADGNGLYLLVERSKEVRFRRFIQASMPWFTNKVRTRCYGSCHCELGPAQ
jgi:hypothetical protein